MQQVYVLIIQLTPQEPPVVQAPPVILNGICQPFARCILPALPVVLLVCPVSRLIFLLYVVLLLGVQHPVLMGQIVFTAAIGPLPYPQHPPAITHGTLYSIPLLVPPAT